MAKDMDVLIKTEDRTEVDNVTKLIKTMSESEQNKMLIFLQGVKFAEALKAQPVTEQEAVTMAKGINTAEAAAIIGASPQFVRAAMQRGVLNIGIALQMPNSSQWTYNISPKLLAEYTGKDIEKEIKKLRGGE